MRRDDNSAELKSALRRLQITSGIPDGRCDMLCQLFRIRKKEYAKNATIFMSGSPAAVFGALIVGRVQSISYDFLGNRKIIAEYHPWECFAVTNVSGINGEYSFDYVAAEPSTVLLFDISDVFESGSAFSAPDRLLAAKLLHGEAVRQSQRYERHISAMQGRTLREKLMIFLADRIREKGSHDFVIDFSRQELADYLCVDRSSLCRELSAMKEQGLLTCSGKKFHVASDSDFDG